MINIEKTSASPASIPMYRSALHGKAVLPRACIMVCRFIATVLGALHAWAAASRHSMNADGISYLDIGDAYMRGEWGLAINAVWSPLYSWILGLVMHLLKPSMAWEFPVVQIVNFIIYLGTLVSFEYFWREMTHYRNVVRDSAGAGRVSLPDWQWLSLGYIIFIFSSLGLIELWAVTPDMLMAGFVYLAAGLILRIRTNSATLGTFALLGAILGLGYLAKAVMFPFAFLFLGVSLFSTDRLRLAVPRVLIATVMFLVFSVPFIAAVSYTKGRLTFGDAANLTYMKHVNGVPYPHWQGEPPGNGTPVHPSRKIHDRPPIYEFGTPIAGTYPISYDPSYWYEGLLVRFELKKQVGYLLESVLYYFDVFFRQQAGLSFGVLLLYLLMGRWQKIRITKLLSQWGLIVPALTAFAFYGLVNVTGRYIGVFVTLFWADLLANVHVPDSERSRRLLSSLGALMVVFMLTNLLAFNLEGFRDLTGFGKIEQVASSQQATRPRWPGEVAEELRRLGIGSGDKVAVIGYAFDSYWARLARVRIVAEMLDWQADHFWLGTPSVQSKSLQAFAGSGAKAIVAERVPSYASLPGWHRVGKSNYYIFIFT